jgi:hypothetical protein
MGSAFQGWPLAGSDARWRLEPPPIIPRRSGGPAMLIESLIILTVACLIWTGIVFFLFPVKVSHDDQPAKPDDQA